jgi:hypothetical protein
VVLPGLEPGTSSLSVPHPTFHSVLICPVIWLLSSIFTCAEHLQCPKRSVPVAVNGPGHRPRALISPFFLPVNPYKH